MADCEVQGLCFVVLHVAFHLLDQIWTLLQTYRQQQQRRRLATYVHVHHCILLAYL